MTIIAYNYVTKLQTYLYKYDNNRYRVILTQVQKQNKEHKN